MMRQRVVAVIGVGALGSLIIGGGAILAARGQAQRPGDMTQARVWVENRSANEAIPVVLQNPAAPLRVQIDPSSIVAARAARQQWEYRSISLATSDDPAKVLQNAGAQGWEAVGILQSGPAGATVLLKRPQ